MVSWLPCWALTLHKRAWTGLATGSKNKPSPGAQQLLHPEDVSCGAGHQAGTIVKDIGSLGSVGTDAASKGQGPAQTSTLTGPFFAPVPSLPLPAGDGVWVGWMAGRRIIMIFNG